MSFKLNCVDIQKMNLCDGKIGQTGIGVSITGSTGSTGQTGSTGSTGQTGPTGSTAIQAYGEMNLAGEPQQQITNGLTGTTLSVLQRGEYLNMGYTNSSLIINLSGNYLLNVNVDGNINQNNIDVNLYVDINNIPSKARASNHFQQNGSDEGFAITSILSLNQDDIITLRMTHTNSANKTFSFHSCNLTLVYLSPLPINLFL